ncbi:MAG: carboxy-terminal-processing protease, carboxyl-terminal processing protease [Candidatus Parcubacteria bacterium]|jgi:carboxyl-terminal processing protease
MRFPRLFLLTVIAFALGYMIGVNKIEVDWKNYRPTVSVVNKEPPNPDQKLDLGPMWIVMEKLQTQYYDKTKIDSQKMLNGAITGLVSSLDDPYTVYLPPVQNTQFKQTLAGQFEGIGAELGMKDKQIIVVAPLEGSPAQKAGIRAGDAIVKVDDAPTFGWTLNQAIEKIRGPKGTKVTLSVLHKNEQSLKDIAVSRDTISVKSVFLWTKKIQNIDEINQKAFPKEQLQNEVAYIRLSQFGDSTNEEWLSLINKLSLEVQRNKNIKGLVLDLRNNPGGYLTDATFISSEFLPIGKTVVTQDDGNGNTLDLKVEKKGVLLNLPMVILVNKGSASASEILSGAMRDYDRALIVGETSFGKGTIQTAEDLGGGAGIHITIAKWLTPKGTWVHQKGIEPDIVVEPDAKNLARDAQLEKAIETLLANQTAVVARSN